jgi:hypothetical protein
MSCRCATARPKFERGTGGGSCVDAWSTGKDLKGYIFGIGGIDCAKVIYGGENIR